MRPWRSCSSPSRSRFASATIADRKFKGWGPTGANPLPTSPLWDTENLLRRNKGRLNFLSAEPEYFRGHVREPDVDDLHCIARDLGLEEVEIVGRNWAGLLSPNPWVRRLAVVAGPVLIHRPSLCSDLYLIGRKPR